MRLLSEVHDEIKSVNENETEKQAHYFNKNKREFEFKIGDKVWKKNKNTLVSCGQRHGQTSSELQTENAARAARDSLKTGTHAERNSYSKKTR